MKYGIIKCECGKEFYFETMRDTINCIDCNKEYDVSEYPEKGETPKEGD